MNSIHGTENATGYIGEFKEKTNIHFRFFLKSGCGRNARTGFRAHSVLTTTSTVGFGSIQKVTGNSRVAFQFTSLTEEM